LNALDKLNKRFSQLALLLKVPINMETIERDYSKLIKAIFYCQMKVQKSYNIDFIKSLLKKLKNKIYSLRQHLENNFIQELKMLQKNSQRNVTFLFVIIRKFVKIEIIANQFIKEFGFAQGTDSYFFKNDVQILKNTIEHIKKVQPALMRSETENYLYNIKLKIESKKL
jgi:succinate dehydrogenase/fumarate reductase flavoprotein subunit